MYTKPTLVVPPDYIRLSDSKHFSQFCQILSDYFSKLLPLHNNELVIICIGTDRATGDSLGPLVGYKLLDLHFDRVTVFGTLEHPIHAKNIAQTLDLLKLDHPNALVLAIDASLGNMKNVGSITIAQGPLHPGVGVDKNLPPIGHLHITGIVNFTSPMNMVILQNTRLSIVMQMADVISSGIRYTLWKYYKTLL